MKHIILKLSIAAILFSNFVNAQTNNSSDTHLGDEYLALYTDLKFDEMMAFYSDDSVFEDPTMSFFSKDLSYEIIKGPKNINAFLKEGFKKITNTEFIIEKQYKVGAIQFYYGTLNYKYNIGKESESKVITFSIPLAIILTIKDDKVIHHQDIADYNIWLKQYNEQLN
ncbi:hypothetical protein GCM10011531_27200 [Aquaticitalea lipolytica]|uniref:SnoaL-like domain-containing protein n=1 Tax=Aquaticitalea lipolytica TaxID=1247562 RepID=A0A8J2TU88_9FLAO|nr:nuclear transport factor 2 family protein [Aquaticitalea lipolytica]GFZ93821.1 hypothetical protein GCM10011531_27200 [Aquaticitalea lipolytica]